MRQGQTMMVFFSNMRPIDHSLYLSPSPNHPSLTIITVQNYVHDMCAHKAGQWLVNMCKLGKRCKQPIREADPMSLAVNLKVNLKSLTLALTLKVPVQQFNNCCKLCKRILYSNWRSHLALVVGSILGALPPCTRIGRASVSKSFECAVTLQ